MALAGAQRRHAVKGRRSFSAAEEGPFPGAGRMPDPNPLGSAQLRRFAPEAGNDGQRFLT